MAGEREQVWSELLALEDEVRFASNFPHAYAVAKETMRRVRGNIEILVDRLHKLGYQFAHPDSADLPPDRRATGQIQQTEESLGPLPLSLRAFYQIVGSVDFRQSRDQLIADNRPERFSATEIQWLGEEDPLVVAPLGELAEEAASAGRTLDFCFAEDEFHKANYSGGGELPRLAPESRADFEIVGMNEIDERFIESLRACLLGVASEVALSSLRMTNPGVGRFSRGSRSHADWRRRSCRFEAAGPAWKLNGKPTGGSVSDADERRPRQVSYLIPDEIPL